MRKSAFEGQPPATERDFWIVKGIQIARGNPHPNPSKGTRIPRPPAPVPMDSNSGKIMASCIISIIVVLLVTAIRVIGKVRSKRSRLGWDDWLLIVAVIAFCALAGQTLVQTLIGGTGKHQYNVTYEELENRIGLASAAWWMYYLVIVPTKLSVICFNARLTGLVSSFWRWTHRVFFVAICIYGIFWVPWYIFLTVPVSARYSYIVTAHHPEFHFVRVWSGYINTISTGIHIGSDWLLLAIPVYLVAKLQMPVAKKLRCIIPISVGCLSAIGAIVSLYYRYHMFEDTAYRQDVLVAWRHVDMVCAIIATSLPAVASIAYSALPASLKKRFSSQRSTPAVFRTDISNPFSHEKGAATVPGAGKRTNRDRYENETIDDEADDSGTSSSAWKKHGDRREDLESGSQSTPWEKDSQSGDSGFGSRSHVKEQSEDSIERIGTAK